MIFLNLSKYSIKAERVHCVVDGYYNCQSRHMVFQVCALLYHIVPLRCSSCLSRPNLHCHFVKMIKCGAYSLKNFRISPRWAVYRVQHLVHVSLQIHFCRIFSCEENLVVEVRVKVCVPSWNLAYPSGTFRFIIVNGDITMR